MALELGTAFDIDDIAEYIDGPLHETEGDREVGPVLPGSPRPGSTRLGGPRTSPHQTPPASHA